jgi:hypothetical protein
MSVYVNNIAINSGADFSQELTLEQSGGGVTNLTGYGISSYIRKHSESSTIVAGFGVTFINVSGGKIVLSLGSSITSGIKEGRYVYDILAIKPNGNKNIIVEGGVLVRAGMSS